MTAKYQDEFYEQIRFSVGLFIIQIKYENVEFSSECFCFFFRSISTSVLIPFGVYVWAFFCLCNTRWAIFFTFFFFFWFGELVKRTSQNYSHMNITSGTKSKGQKIRFYVYECEKRNSFSSPIPLYYSGSVSFAAAKPKWKNNHHTRGAFASLEAHFMLLSFIHGISVAKTETCISMPNQKHWMLCHDGEKINSRSVTILK